MSMTEEPTFSLFGFGRDGLPSDVDLWIASNGGTDQIARDIIDACQQWREGKVRGPYRISDKQLSPLRTKIFVLIQYHRKMGTIPSSEIMEALAYVLGLVSPKSLNPMPSAEVVREIGLPAVDDLDKFFEAAKLDGEADAAGSEWSVNQLAQLVKASRDSIVRWRGLQEYQQRRAFVKAVSPRG